MKEKRSSINNKTDAIFLRVQILIQLQEGIDLLKTSLESKKEVYGDLSEEVADSWKLIGSTYLSKGDMEKALRALKKVL